MIIKEEPDISRYIKMREGEMKIGEYKLSYRLISGSSLIIIFLLLFPSLTF